MNRIPAPTEVTDLDLVRGVNKRDIPKLISIGVKSVEALAAADPDDFVKKLRWTEKKCREIVVHAKALHHRKIFPKAPFAPPEGLIFFYDVETFGAMTYLHGVIRYDGDSREERSFLAENPLEECKAWMEFLDYLAEDDGGIVYSWTDYERKRVNPLWEKYGGNEKGWKLLDANLIDQCALMRDHFAFPTKGYGLKRVAPVFGFDWHTPDPDGRKAEMWYRLWLETGNRAFIDEILEYNLDDVRAMEAIHNGVRAGIPE